MITRIGHFRKLLDDTTMNEFMQMHPNGIAHTKNVNDDVYTFSTMDGDRVVSRIVLEDMEDGYWELGDVLGRKKYAEIIRPDGVFKLLGMDTSDGNRKQGVATDLLQYALGNIKKTGASQVYMFAKPTGVNGPGAESLVKFYNKFGFNAIQDTKEGTLMLLDL